MRSLKHAKAVASALSNASHAQTSANASVQCVGARCQALVLCAPADACMSATLSQKSDDAHVHLKRAAALQSCTSTVGPQQLRISYQQI